MIGYLGYRATRRTLRASNRALKAQSRKSAQKRSAAPVVAHTPYHPSNTTERVGYALGIVLGVGGIALLCVFIAVWLPALMHVK